MMKARIALSLIVLLSADVAHAAGFGLSNQGARSAGRANAFAATVDDPSALFYNPAGITQLDGLQSYGTGVLIFPVVTFEAPDGGETDMTTEVAFTISGYATAKLTDIFSVGSGIIPPFGLALTWPPNSPAASIVRKIELRTYFIPIVLGVDLSPVGAKGLSLAAGIDLVPASAGLIRDIPFGSETARVKWQGDDFGVGGRFGLLYRPHVLPQLSIGLAYQMPVTFEFEGNTNFRADNPTVRAQLPPDGQGSTEITVPMIARAGAAYYVIEDLQLEFDLVWTGWYVFDELRLHLPGDSEIVAERDWDSQFSYHAGIEYSPDPWAVRAGYAYSPTPVPTTTLDFTLPDVNRHEISVGFSHALPWHLWIDFFGWLIIPRDRETSDQIGNPPVKGTYSDFAWEVGLGLGGELDWLGETVF